MIITGQFAEKLNLSKCLIDNIIESCKEQGIDLKDLQERINEITSQKETNQYKEKDDDGR